MTTPSTSPDSFDTRRDLSVGDKTYSYYSLAAAEEAGLPVARLPVSMKVLLENLLRNEGPTVSPADIRALADFVNSRGKVEHEIAFRPARVLMQDFTGVPAVVDLAAMRDADAQPRRRSLQDQSAKPGGPCDRPLGHGRLLRHRQVGGREQGEGV